MNHLIGDCNMNEQFAEIFQQLKKILMNYEPQLSISVSDEMNYSLDAGYSAKYKRNIFFGAVNIKKNYVSFHLMPVYVFPELLINISPGLKKRMQGKSCFNFKKIETSELKELEILTSQGFKAFKKEKLV